MRYFRFFLIFCFFNFYAVADIDPNNITDYCGPVKVLKLGSNTDSSNNYFLKFGVNKIGYIIPDTKKIQYTFRSKKLSPFGGVDDTEHKNNILFSQFILASYTLQPTIYVSRDRGFNNKCNHGLSESSNPKIDFLLLLHGVLK